MVSKLKFLAEYKCSAKITAKGTTIYNDILYYDLAYDVTKYWKGAQQFCLWNEIGDYKLRLGKGPAGTPTA